MVFLSLWVDKLKAAWEGPHGMADKLDDVTYIVEMERTGKRAKVFHINMLKPFLDCNGVRPRGGRN